MKAQFPPEKHNRMVNAHLQSGALDLSATDWMVSPAFEPKQGNTYAIFGMYVGVPIYRILQVEKDRLPVASETHQPNQALAPAPQ